MPKTPTTRATWQNGGLVHHALVQPHLPGDSNYCDLLVSCRGYVQRANSLYLGNYDNMITCMSCLGTNWEFTVDKMEADGLLTKVEDLETDSVLHRILMEGNAFARTAMRPTRR